MSPPTFGFVYFSIINQGIGAAPEERAGMRGGAEEGSALPGGNHPPGAGTAPEPGRYRSGSAATQGNEENWIQTSANVAQVSGSGSFRPRGFCNPCLLKQVFSLPLFATGWERKVDARLTKVLQRFWFCLPGHSQRTWPTPAGGAIVAWGFSEPSLTFFMVLPSLFLLSQRALRAGPLIQRRYWTLGSTFLLPREHLQS